MFEAIGNFFSSIWWFITTIFSTAWSLIGWSWFLTVHGLFFVGFTSVFSYLALVALQIFKYREEQNVKEKYQTEWAVVTGGSSGIGKALCEKLAVQGLNVVIVALDDDLLKTTHKELSEKFSSQQFRTVGVDLSSADACNEIAQQTEDLDVGLFFNNAGYILYGIFTDVPLDRQMKNFSVNCGISVGLTHIFANRMIAKGRKGAIYFTSSPACLIPGPTACLYGATKAFLTSFATTLAVELHPDNIDVMVLHPSPVDTGFYKAEGVDRSSSLAFFQKTANSPERIASTILCNLGQPLVVIRDQGYFPIITNLILKALDYHALVVIMQRFIATNGDYLKEREKRQKKE